MNIENSTKPPQDNANCGDFKGRIEDHSDITGGTSSDIKDFTGTVDQAIEEKEFTEAPIEATHEARRRRHPAFMLPEEYLGPRPTWIHHTMQNKKDMSGYKMFLGGLRHQVHNRHISEWLKEDCNDEVLIQSIGYVADINVVPPSPNQRSSDYKAPTLRNLMEGYT